jgi:hypothetical protein
MEDNNIKRLNTIDGSLSSSDRRSGNTTRQADYAIQLLFSHPKVELTVVDHHLGGKDKASNKTLFKIILHRLVVDHELAAAIDNGLAVVDYKKFIIRWGRPS